MKLAFIDFWPNFEEDNNYWYHLLDSAYDVEIDPNNRNGKATPDLMFLHTDSYRFLDRKNYVDTTATRVFWTMEGVPPNFDADTYAPYPSIRTIGGVGYNDPNSSLTKLSNDFDRFVRGATKGDGNPLTSQDRAVLLSLIEKKFVVM